VRPPRIEPGPGQESVWDYPRPPALESTASLLVVTFAGEVVAETRQGLRVLETSHPPNYYFPSADVRRDLVVDAPGTSFCEWKGRARYLTVQVGRSVAEQAAWVYDTPSPRFDALAGHVAFYPGRVDACFVDGERVAAQEGGFYGGWITRALVGPFKGAPGTRAW
jgi:uncharacterized protein (DUF427 family)